MQKFLIIGGGKGGRAILATLSSVEFVSVIGIVDVRDDAPAVIEAKALGIQTGHDMEPFLKYRPDVILEVTGDPAIYPALLQRNLVGTMIISGDVAKLMVRLIHEKERWFRAWFGRQQELEAILNSTHDGMIAVNKQGNITLFNRAAEKIVGLKGDEVVGKPVVNTISNTRLHYILEKGLPELNRMQTLSSGTEIMSNRVPVRNEKGEVVGAVAVFRDVSELKDLNKQVTDLESVKMMLQAIINSSDDAISVVDENGLGMLINPAYTRLTGLEPIDVIGKPAETDISEGESMHMRVLQSQKPVRGVRLKVGPYRKEVVVNVAPIMNGDQLKGSVGILHDVTELTQLNRDLERARRIIRTLEAKYTFDDIMGSSEAMYVAQEQARQAAKTRATVLLRGESGTGKELFAHSIHHASDRKYNQFVRVNCAALSETLLESELFGYEEGAFTGAKKGGKTGLFEEASGGTLFLDEIGELAPSTQAKLLRVLQEKEVIRVGGTKAIPVDVRVIAATHVQLEHAIQTKRFREDLYYRLNVLPIQIPPLRMHKEDLSELALHLIKKINQEYGRYVEVIDEKALEQLRQYDWPGNVRELENVLGRAMINMGFHDKVIMSTHLPVLHAVSSKQDEQDIVAEGSEVISLKEALHKYEKSYVQKIFEQCGHNKTETAKRLGVSIRSLYYKLEKYELL
ncbi:sigma-54-dependent transcriptional regulator [Hazenella sp. IB182357]|uniref:Sigma-54-dependent transcriptional regulator n=1 Tax=Polycladospora coralii TaxID=2771432 RepID=A0A926NA24_9BACL|nr:sigma-54-dependent Fis family transcriptional regulator [Polycladospora coralii]MBD1372996.1 sigma-54-dependent transcriptional regulator [Polycladospora coralii]MBS7530945.1 sigma-54-dependent transcriptional regulator [Polycladospora coralii]